MITIRINPGMQPGTAYLTAPHDGMVTGEAPAVVQLWTKEIQAIGYTARVRELADDLVNALRADGFKVEILDKTRKG